MGSLSQEFEVSEESIELEGSYLLEEIEWDK